MEDERRETLVRTIEDLQRVIRDRDQQIADLRGKCRDLAKELEEAKPADAIVIPRSDLPEVEERNGNLYAEDFVAASNTSDGCRRVARRFLAWAEHLDAQDPDPLAVGDRVRVVKPEDVNGMRVHVFAVGDVGKVIREAAEDGEIRFRRDGTKYTEWVAAANVERIED